jgi:hypothetical protein
MSCLMVAEALCANTWRAKSVSVGGTRLVRGMLPAAHHYLTVSKGKGERHHQFPLVSPCPRNQSSDVSRHDPCVGLRASRTTRAILGWYYPCCRACWSKLLNDARTAANTIWRNGGRETARHSLVNERQSQKQNKVERKRSDLLPLPY